MRESECFREREKGNPFIWYQSCIRAMVEIRASRVQANLEEQIPIAPKEAHGVPLGAEVRNAMPMRPNNQDFRVRANQPQVGMQTGEFFENGMDPFWVNLVTRLRKEGM
jgi:hypothetical protein